ncbi:hypothetical protein GA0116948_104276 [Chitinophaga costaii]|uniref:Uncharacterized protein n=1 Tax=Chitinophaga costaii TaxID=1335309 RepID=A0A1C4CSF3_9BACT|nr:hypothetical protein GA0116948_104276 [Chitinophaga costaii]
MPPYSCPSMVIMDKLVRIIMVYTQRYLNSACKMPCFIQDMKKLA